MKRSILLVLLSLFLVHCASPSLKYKEIKGSYEENIENLDLENSFAFIYNGDEYYFSRTLLVEGDLKCSFFIGFKNNQFKYSFPAHELSELSEIYYGKHSLKNKKAKALKVLDGFAKSPQKCTKNIAKRELTAKDITESALTLLIFAPVLPLTYFFAADDYMKNIKDSFLAKRVNKLRLGMSKHKAESLVGHEFKKAKTSKHLYYYLDIGYHRLALTFDKGKINGMVRGYRDNKKHQ